MVLFDLLSVLFWYLIITIIIAIIVLIVLRLVVGYADLNPFGAVARTVKSLSDPLVLPMRSKLARAGLDPKFAPLITILIVILVGWFALQLVNDVLFTLKGLLSSAASGWVRGLLGYALYGLLAAYALLIFARIIFVWIVSEVHPLMRFLVRATEPLLAPARRLIPPVGMFDISPLVVIIILQLFQRAIAGTLLR
jgi:YggT family protein